MSVYQLEQELYADIGLGTVKCNFSIKIKVRIDIKSKKFQWNNYSLKIAMYKQFIWHSKCQI